MNQIADRLQQITKDIRRLRAENPSPMTGTGTNTYLIETEAGVVVLDPGPNLAGHLDAILAALAAAPVAAILVSHAHLDHSALAPQLAAQTRAPMLAFGTATDGRSQTMQHLAASGLAGSGEGIDTAFAPDQRLTDGEIMHFGNLEIEVLHCPGHMGGHLCFALGDILFSGDHVMAWSSSLISPPDGDMTDYMASLGKLATHVWRQFLPGHGDPISQPNARLHELTQHRRTREAAVLAAVQAGDRTPRQISARVYGGTPAALLCAAERNVLSHLIDLHSKRLVISEDAIDFDSHFRPA